MGASQSLSKPRTNLRKMNNAEAREWIVDSLRSSWVAESKAIAMAEKWLYNGDVLYLMDEDGLGHCFECKIIAYYICQQRKSYKR